MEIEGMLEKLYKDHSKLKELKVEPQRVMAKTTSTCLFHVSNAWNVLVFLVLRHAKPERNVDVALRCSYVLFLRRKISHWTSSPMN